jgi:hypothetical protein
MHRVGLEPMTPAAEQTKKVVAQRAWALSLALYASYLYCLGMNRDHLHLTQQYTHIIAGSNWNTVIMWRQKK